MTQQVEALRYARLLGWGARTGEVALLLSFVAYVLGVLPPHVPLEQLPKVWNLPVAAYLQYTGTPTGWGWLTLAHKGDLSGLIGISLLAGCSILPLLGLIPLYLTRRDYVYAGICMVVIAELVFAAAGVFTGGH